MNIDGNNYRTIWFENNVVKIIKLEEDAGHCEISAAENFIKEI